MYTTNPCICYEPVTWEVIEVLDDVYNFILSVNVRILKVHLDRHSVLSFADMSVEMTHTHTQRNNSTVQWNSCKGIYFWLGWLVGWTCRRNYYGRCTTMELDRTINIKEWEKSEPIEIQAAIRAYMVVVQCLPVSPWIRSRQPLWSAPDECPALLYELQWCKNGPTSNRGVSGFKAVFADFRRVQSQFEIDFQIDAKLTPISILNCPIILNINLNVFSSVSQHFCFGR